MDALSEALRSVRMTGAIFLDAEFTAPWSFRSPLAQQAAPVVAPGTEQLIIYHLVIDGMAWVKIAGEPDLPVEAGEIVIIPHGEEHLFGNGTPDTVFDGAATLGGEVRFSMIAFLAPSSMALNCAITCALGPHGQA